MNENTLAASEPSVSHYYVDESGDGVLFDRRGRVLVSGPGQAHFILGLADVKDPEELARDVARLRSEILADPYFQNVPSLQPERNRTARSFHCKDDLPEIRREFFRLLAKKRIRFYAVVMTMSGVLEYVRRRNLTDPHYRYHPNELYDHTVRRLFKQRLHQQEKYRISFAKRGSSDRTRAIANQIERTRRQFLIEYPGDHVCEIEVLSEFSHASPGFQAVDYFLWSVHRLFSRGEDRYLAVRWSSVGLIHDVHDTGTAAYGTYYSQRNPISLEAVMKRKVPDIGSNTETATDHTA